MDAAGLIAVDFERLVEAGGLSVGSLGTNVLHGQTVLAKMATGLIHVGHDLLQAGEENHVLRAQAIASKVLPVAEPIRSSPASVTACTLPRVKSGAAANSRF